MEVVKLVAPVTSACRDVRRGAPIAGGGNRKGGWNTLSAARASPAAGSAAVLAGWSGAAAGFVVVQDCAERWVFQHVAFVSPAPRA